MGSNNDLDDISVEEMKRKDSDKNQIVQSIGEKWSSPMATPKRVEEIKKESKDLDYILSMHTDELFKNTSPTMKESFPAVSDFRASAPKIEDEPEKKDKP